MNCLIVDDSQVSRVLLKKLMTLNSELVLIDCCKNAGEALNLIENHQIDLLFLDIEMPGMNGIELVKSLNGKKSPMVIFVTSRADYAVEAFDMDVVDFLVKPVTSERFLLAMQKVQSQKNKMLISGEMQHEDFIFIRDVNVIRKVKLVDVLYLEAQGDYVKINLPKEEFEPPYYNIHSTLKSAEKKLPTQIFMKVHRSFIINVSKIETIEQGVVYINGHKVPVSDAYRSSLNKRLQIL